MSLEEQFSQAREGVNKLSRRPSELQLLKLASVLLLNDRNVEDLQ